MTLREVTRDVNQLENLARKYPDLRMEVPSAMWGFCRQGRVLMSSHKSLTRLYGAAALVKESTLADGALIEEMRAFCNKVARELDNVQDQLEAEL